MDPMKLMFGLHVCRFDLILPKNADSCSILGELILSKEKFSKSPTSSLKRTSVADS